MVALAGNPHATTVVITPDRLVDFFKHGQSLHINRGVDVRVLGGPVVVDRTGGSSRRCGAPEEPNVCSYCKGPTSYVLVT